MRAVWRHAVCKRILRTDEQLIFVDVVSYNTILKAHLVLGRFQDAHSLLQEMTERGLLANKVTYNKS